MGVLILLVVAVVAIVAIIAVVARARTEERSAHAPPEVASELGRRADGALALAHEEQYANAHAAATKILDEVDGEPDAFTGAIVHAALAIGCAGLGRSDDAREALARAREVVAVSCEDATADEADEVAARRSFEVEQITHVAAAFEERGDEARARDALREAFALAQEHLGDEHEMTAQCRLALANAASRAGDADEALALYRRAWKDALAAEELDTLRAIADQLAQLGIGLGREDAIKVADKRYRELVAVLEERGDDVEVALVRGHLCRLHARAGNRAKARAHRDAALAIFERCAEGDDDPIVEASRAAMDALFQEALVR